MNGKLSALFGVNCDVEFDPLPVGIKRQLAAQLAKPTANPDGTQSPPRPVRRPFDHLALAVRLTDDDSPAGEIFQVFMKDISLEGIDFVHTRALHNERIAVKLTSIKGGSAVLIGRTIRCVCQQRWYEIGLDFKNQHGEVPANASVPGGKTEDEKSTSEPPPSDPSAEQRPLLASAVEASTH